MYIGFCVAMSFDLEIYHIYITYIILLLLLLYIRVRFKFIDSKLIMILKKSLRGFAV